MAGDRQTTWVLVAIVIIALIGVFFAAQQGGLRRQQPVREYPFWYFGEECCTCSRTLMSGFEGVRLGMTETLFKNVKARDCSELCNYVHQRTKVPGWQYSVNAFISKDPACEVLKPVPQFQRAQPTLPVERQRAGVGAYRSSPAQGIYE